MTIYTPLKQYLEKVISEHGIWDEPVRIRCKALSVKEAIGTPDRDDYPIVKGREVMVEAEFRGARGQAFTDDFENRDLTLKDLVTMNLEGNHDRACFVSGLNAVMRSLGLCEKTVHCRDQEPKDCAGHLNELIPPKSRVALIGYQPGFLSALAPNYTVRVIDLDKDNIGKTVSGVTIESHESTMDAIADSDVVLVTGSSLVNGTIGDFLDLDKPVVFFGVTISGAAKILNLQTYCRCGH